MKGAKQILILNKASHAVDSQLSASMLAVKAAPSIFALGGKLGESSDETDIAAYLGLGATLRAMAADADLRAFASTYSS